MSWGISKAFSHGWIEVGMSCLFRLFHFFSVYMHAQKQVYDSSSIVIDSFMHIYIIYIPWRWQNVRALRALQTPTIYRVLAYASFHSTVFIPSTSSAYSHLFFFSFFLSFRLCLISNTTNNHKSQLHFKHRGYRFKYLYIYASTIPTDYVPSCSWWFCMTFLMETHNYCTRKDEK